MCGVLPSSTYGKSSQISSMTMAWMQDTGTMEEGVAWRRLCDGGAAQSGCSGRSDLMPAALLHSSTPTAGWYVPRTESVGYREWGKGAGCTFVTDTCASVATASSGKYFCTAAGTSGAS